MGIYRKAIGRAENPPGRIQYHHGRCSLSWRERHHRHVGQDGSGNIFTDHDFHDYLETEQVQREPKPSGFMQRAAKAAACAYFNAFATRTISKRHVPWSAQKNSRKPHKWRKSIFKAQWHRFFTYVEECRRFTVWQDLALYDLIRQMVSPGRWLWLIVRYLHNSWADDFSPVGCWRGTCICIVETECFARRIWGPGADDEYIVLTSDNEKLPGMVLWIAAGLKGSFILVI